jgi:broad specificity phosphatase PhoE
MPPGRLLLVRHGESEGNRDRRFSVDTDIKLTDLGVRQARTVGATIAREFRPSLIIASPYRRARDTAALIAEVLGFRGAIAIEHDLHERSIGVLAGEPYRSTREDPRYDPGRFWDWRPDGGESLEDVRVRASAVIERLAATYREEDVVVVSHGGVMLALCAHIEGSWRTAVAGNCELLVVEHAGVLPPAVGATFRCVVQEDGSDAAAPLGLESRDRSTESTG